MEIDAPSTLRTLFLFLLKNVSPDVPIVAAGTTYEQHIGCVWRLTHALLLLHYYIAMPTKQLAIDIGIYSSMVLTYLGTT